jgi:hypothetical protein
MKVPNKQHILRTPLVVYSQTPYGEIGILPIGTTLRYVESFPEGFDRFTVFVNVERSPLALEEVNPPELVNPLSAIPGAAFESDGPPVAIEMLQKILRSLGIKREDLERLLDYYA